MNVFGDHCLENRAGGENPSRLARKIKQPPPPPSLPKVQDVVMEDLFGTKLKCICVMQILYSCIVLAVS